MVIRYGARKLAVCKHNCTSSRPLGAARGFFSAFYQWSQPRCYASGRNVVRANHTANSPEPHDAAKPVSMSNREPQHHRWEPSSPEMLSEDIRHIMRSLPHSVVVLTTSTREKNEKIDQIIRAVRDKSRTSRNPQSVKTFGGLSHRPLSAIAAGNLIFYGKAEEGLASEHRTISNVGSAVSTESSIHESSSAGPFVDHGRMPKERWGIRGFSNGRKNYYGIRAEEWGSNLESSIRHLEQNAYEDYRAMTLSSFTTVCLSNPPMISFNIRSPSKTLDALRNASGRFMIHVLEANSAGAKIASAFSKGGGGTQGFDRLEVKEFYDSTGKNSRKTIALPVIKAPGVKKVLYCQIGNGISRSINRKTSHSFDVFPVGDHHVVFARVLAVLNEPKTEAVEVGGEHVEKWHSLSYANGQYRDLKGVISLEPESNLERAKPQEPIMEEPKLNNGPIFAKVEGSEGSKLEDPVEDPKVEET